MDKIYHGCRKRHPDGSHVVRGKDSNYFIPTTDSFWKGPHDIINAVKTLTNWKTKSYRLEKYDELF